MKTKRYPMSLLPAASLLLGALAAQLPAQDPEAAGLAAEQAGRLKEAFQLYLAALQALPDPPPLEADLRFRERIIKLVPRLDPPPAVPEEAERAAVRGQVIFSEAQDTLGYERAAAEFRKAVRAAPWLAPAAFNLALVQQKLGQHRAALGNMKRYLLTAPADADQARAKLYELEYKLEQQAERLRRYTSGFVPKTPAEALTVYSEACSTGIARGCSDLGILYRYGEGVPEERERALNLFKRGCDGGDGKGCYFLAGEHESTDAARALALFQQAATATLP